MTMPPLFALKQAPASIRPSTGRTEKGDADAGELWASIVEASSEDRGAETTAHIDATATDDATVTGDAPAAGTAPFSLSSFLQVLAKAGTAVAVAAGRDPAMAEAVRRLPVPEVPDEVAVSSRPVALQQGASLRLPEFLVPATERAGSRSAVAADAPRAPVSDAMVPIEVVPAQAAPSAAQLGAFAALRGTLQSMLAARPPAAVAAAGAGASGKAVSTVSASTIPGEDGPIAGDTTRVGSVVVSPSTARRESDSRGLDSIRVVDRRAAEPRQSKFGGSAVAANALTATAPSAIGSANSPALQSAVTHPDPSSAFDLSGPAALSAMSSMMVSDPSSAAADIGNADGLLRSPVGSQGWHEELGAQLAVMIDADGESEAVMKLAPEELGELEIRVQIRDGEASVQFGAVNAEARQAIEAAQPRLREMFASQGMGVSNFSVFNTVSGNPHSSSKHGGGSSRSPRSGVAVHDEVEVRVTGRESQGIVDLYA
jgi:flagellar hook-length control protein FliK